MCHPLPLSECYLKKKKIALIFIVRFFFLRLSVHEALPPYFQLVTEMSPRMLTSSDKQAIDRSKADTHGMLQMPCMKLHF